MHGTIPNVGFKYDKDERIHDLEYISAEIDEATRQSTKAEDIQKCLHAGVLPACYKYMRLGEIPSYAYENFNEMYDAYHKLGGNGMVTKMKQEIEELHLKKKGQ